MHAIDLTQPLSPATTTPQPRPTRAEQARINGANSKGPTSLIGKAKCSRNALKHGLTAEKHAVLDIERPAEYKLAYDAAIDEFRPQSLFTLRLVEKLAHLDWRIERLAMLDNGLLNHKVNEAAGLPAADLEGDDEIAALVRGWISAVGSANALELLRRYSTTLQHQFNTTLTNLQKLEKRQAAQLRDRDLPYQKPECAPIEEEPSSSPDHANASQQTTVESDEAPQPAAAEPPTTTQPIHAETSKQTNPRRPATTSPTRTVPNVPSSGQEKRR